jgi:hypothetical protein
MNDRTLRVLIGVSLIVVIALGVQRFGHNANRAQAESEKIGAAVEKVEAEIDLKTASPN